MNVIIFHEELEVAMEERGVDRHWTLINTIARNSTRVVSPLLAQRQQCWEDDALVELENLNKDWTEFGSTLITRLQSLDAVRVCCQHEAAHGCAQGHYCASAQGDDDIRESDDDDEDGPDGILECTNGLNQAEQYKKATRLCGLVLEYCLAAASTWSECRTTACDNCMA